MVRPALSAARGADILDFMARFPARDFKLSEIVSGTGVNLASCHAILAALEDRGYLSRCPRRKTYRLGSALVALGQVAAASQPLVAMARDAAGRLVQELGLALVLSTVVGEEIIGIVAVDTPDGRTAGLNVGERMPLVPPVGASFLAWEDESAINAWLDRASPRHDPDDLAYWRQGLASIRARSFQVELRAPDSTALADRMASMAAGNKVSRYKGELLELVHSLGRHPMQPERIDFDQDYELILIAAPIFDQDGRCAYNLCLGGFAGPVSGEMVMALGTRLVETCLQIMQADRARA